MDASLVKQARPPLLVCIIYLYAFVKTISNNE